jgi:hypothetical protein
MRISRERRELISAYATAAICLYGVISIEEFVIVFNRYEQISTTSDEVLFALKRLALADDVEYSIFNSIISGPEFQPQFDDYNEHVTAIRSSQEGKPRYLPDKERFLKYTDLDYLEPEKPYSDLKAYILEHQLTTRGEGIDGVDGDLIDLHEMIQFGVDTTSLYDYFTERGYQYKNMRILDDFVKLIANAHNNTRMYDNNGLTPFELAGVFERLKSDTSKTDQKFHASVFKAGRNDPCPCGSGLKFKNCHGKQ